MLLQQGTALALGHAAPHAEFDPVVQGVGTALDDDRAVPTDDGSLPLGGAPHEQLVRVRGSAQRFGNPGDPGLVSHLQ